jgi:hypothetical protein
MFRQQALSGAGGEVRAVRVSMDWATYLWFAELVMHHPEPGHVPQQPEWQPSTFTVVPHQQGETKNSSLDVDLLGVSHSLNGIFNPLLHLFGQLDSGASRSESKLSDIGIAQSGRLKVGATRLAQGEFQIEGRAIVMAPTPLSAPKSRHLVSEILVMERIVQ